ncbi:MAG: GNAT family N-acetyltransferase [Anaerolineae bacterium]|nr:GNAT family N-acetyltransferase [Anaerolineae bacterium]
MFHAMGLTDDARLNQMDAAFADWLNARLADGRYIGLLACAEDGEIAAGAGIWLLDWLPTYYCPHQERAYLLNVYTEPSHRRRGLARALVTACIETCVARRVPLIMLHASSEGRAVYESLGFTGSNEMRLFLEGGP